MALTDTAIKVLKPKAKRYFVTDDRGLSLEVYPTGGVAWRYRYRLNGKLEKVALGKYPALSLKGARLKRDELAATVAQGQSPAQQKQLRKAALATATTVREFGELYFVDVVTRDRKRHEDHASLSGQGALPGAGRQANAGGRSRGRAAHRPGEARPRLPGGGGRHPEFVQAHVGLRAGARRGGHEPSRSVAGAVHHKDASPHAGVIAG